MKFIKKRYLFDEEILNEFKDEEEQLEDKSPEAKNDDLKKWIREHDLVLKVKAAGPDNLKGFTLFGKNGGSYGWNWSAFSHDKYSILVVGGFRIPSFVKGKEIAINALESEIKNFIEVNDSEVAELEDDMPENAIVFSLEKGSGKYQVPEKFKDVDAKEVLKELKINKQISGKFKGIKETSYAILGNTIPENLWSALMATQQESVMYVKKDLKAEFWDLVAGDKPKYKKIGSGTLKEVEKEPNDDYSKVDGKFYVVDEKVFELTDVFYDEAEEGENMELTSEELKVLKSLVAFVKNFKLEDEEEKEENEIVDDELEEEKEVEDEEKEENESDTEVEDDEEEKEELDDEEAELENDDEEERVIDTKKKAKDSFSAFNTVYNNKYKDDSWEDDRQIEVASAWARRK